MDRLMPGNQRTEELNQRLLYRNIPSNPLQPQFDIRPLSSKYAKMPIVDRHVNHKVPIQVMQTYDIETTFNPGSAQAPWSGFASNINDESKLRNQFFALQNGGGQSSYIPGKNSELYNPPMQTASPDQQPFPSLFMAQQFEEFNACPKGLGGKFFENCTRQQIKELSS
jgi:hypothetical protein